MKAHRITTALLRRVEDSADDAAQIADAIVAAWRQIDVVLSPIIGRHAVAALHRRSLHLVEAARPLLATGRPDVYALLDLTAVKTTLLQLSAAEAAAAGGAGLEKLYELLGGLLGPALTEHLLGSIVDDLLSASTGQETLR